jgi:hypothetical protein
MRQAMAGIPMSPLALLIGLIILFFVFAHSHASQIAERTIQQIGLEKEDLKVSQRKMVSTLMGRRNALIDLREDKTMNALKTHPQEARELAQIIHENVPDDLLIGV